MLFLGFVWIHRLPHVALLSCQMHYIGAHSSDPFATFKWIWYEEVHNPWLPGMGNTKNLCETLHIQYKHIDISKEQH